MARRRLQRDLRSVSCMLGQFYGAYKRQSYPVRLRWRWRQTKSITGVSEKSVEKKHIQDFIHVISTRSLHVLPRVDSCGSADQTADRNGTST